MFDQKLLEDLQYDDAAAAAEVTAKSDEQTLHRPNCFLFFLNFW